MTPLEAEAQLSQSESRLARRLIDSAQQDEVTAEATRAAWTKLAGSLSLLALQAAPSASTAPADAALHGVKRGTYALTCLALGAIAGSAATAAWFAPAAEPQHVVEVAVASSHSTPASAPPAHLATPPEPTPTVSHRERRAAPVTRPRSLPVVTAPGSTLAAEVAQLDAARTALEIGAFDEAKRLLAAFPQRFPGGELSVEAAVMRLELLVATGDRDEARRVAESFISTHPRDPHAARVRQLAEETRNP